MDISELKKSFFMEQIKDVKAEDLSVKNKEHILIAIKKAYQDTQPRTIKGHGKVADDLEIKTDEKKFDENSEHPFIILCNSFYNYFNDECKKSEKEFDEWHFKICQSFLISYNNILENKNLKKQNFGKAQKIVNMTFKYISCFGDAYKRNDWFKHCHMVLDQYTLAWFSKNVLETYNAQFEEKKNENKKRIVKKEDINTWTALNYITKRENGKTEEIDNIDLYKKIEEGSYFWIQQQIRIYISGKGIYKEKNVAHCLSVFDEEFIIWQNAKIDSVLKEIENLSLLSGLPEYPNKDIYRKLSEIKMSIQKGAK